MPIAAALPIILRLADKPGLTRDVLGCATLPRFHAVPASALDVPALDWSVCPLDLMAHPLVGAVFHLSELAAIAPLTGWPDRFSAWAVGGLLNLRQHQARKKRGEL